MTIIPGRLETIVRLLRWHKPAGRLILLIPALWGVFLAARGVPQVGLVLLMIVGAFATSAAGCVINDLWDRDIDPLVERTRERPLASRELTVQVAVGVGLVALLTAYGLTFFLNGLTFWLCVAAVPFIALYPSAKRFFPVPQLLLSLCWGFAVLISWSAVMGRLEPVTAWLWGATVLWTLGFDTVYALSDREDDLRVGVKSSAIFFGNYAPQAVGLFFLGTVALLAGVGWQMQLGYLYFLTLVWAGVWWAWQYKQLVQPEIPVSLYGKIFVDNVKIGFVLLAGMILGFS
ncbi:4-hydroxybenzoate octaprenyltransferase [Anthocerotibacter panamensis]|uniref:4-hydroxybenzoate octaprenyltransferase n=1 Tax=Anthocerotibacter panamensis TaxID=2857077 RepID=UPI001C40471E|nr:4-hydroxybenzoate octaprenyltransferase [Anthocerotibacter panamensis]